MKLSNYCALGLSLIMLAGCAQSGVAPMVVQNQGAAAMSAQALQGAVHQANQNRFKRADKNGDGKLSPAEVPTLGADGFKAMDTNRDGFLSFDEALGNSQAEQTQASVTAEFAQAQTTQALGSESVSLSLAKEATQDQSSWDGKANPIVFVPGFLDFEFYFTVLKHKLEAEGHPTSYLEIFPNVGDIRVAAAALQKQVDAVRARTGAKKVDLVGHSMGGLIIRYYVKNLGGVNQVDHIVTLASPHHGTIAGYFAPTDGANQMQPGSEFLKQLNARDETPGDIKWTSIRGGMDELIIPHSSPILDGADNELAPHAMHGSIFLDPTAWKYLDAGLKR